MYREVVKIDEALCNGCGECIPGCYEGALQIIDGKARLVSELMCDGLGACIGHCPQNAITVEEREAEAYNEVLVMEQMISRGKSTVFAHLKHLLEHQEYDYLQQALDYIKTNKEKMPFHVNEIHKVLNDQSGGDNNVEVHPERCSGSSSTSFQASGLVFAGKTDMVQSELTHWPVQLHLINPAAEYFKKAHLLIAADCTAFSCGTFHQKFLRGKKLIIACPKLDQSMEIYLRKIIQLIDSSQVASITVVIMEVPCCGGLAGLVKTAIEQSSRTIPIDIFVMSIQGEIKSKMSL